jgi:hypothetical protein
MAVIVAVTCTVSDIRPPGWAPFTAKTTIPADPSCICFILTGFEVAERLQRRSLKRCGTRLQVNNLFLDHAGVDHVANLDIVKVNRLAPQFDREFIAAWSLERYLAVGAVNASDTRIDLKGSGEGSAGHPLVDDGRAAPGGWCRLRLSQLCCG